MRLDNSILQQKSGSTLSSQPASCFTIPLSFGPQKAKTLALLDSGASACFLDEEFARRHNVPLVLKLKPVYVEVIDGRPLLSGNVTHESKPVEIAFENHSSFVTFNIIRTPSNPVVLGLSWLEKHNPTIDWRLRRMTFSKDHSESKPSKRPRNKKKNSLEQERF